MKPLFKKMLLAIAVLALTFSQLYANENGKLAPENSRPLAKLLDQIDLTNEQQQDIKAIVKNYRDDISKLTKKGTFNSTLIAIIKAEKFDSGEAESVIDAINILRKEREIKKMYMMHRVFHILSSEQQVQLNQLFAQPK